MVEFGNVTNLLRWLISQVKLKQFDNLNNYVYYVPTIREG